MLEIPWLWIAWTAAAVAANLPLVALMCRYHGARAALAGLAPNQFLFCLLVFPVAAALIGQGLDGFAQYVASEEAAKTGWTATSARLLDHWYAPGGLVLLAAAAFATIDDRTTFRGVYALRPHEAAATAADINAAVKMLDEVDPASRETVRRVAVGAATPQALQEANVHVGPETMEGLTAALGRIRRTLDGGPVGGSPKLDRQMRLADAAELTAVIAVALSFVLAASMLVLIRKDLEALPAELVSVGRRFIAADVLLLLWVGFRRYSIHELQYVGVRVRDVGGTALALVLVVHTAALLAVCHVTNEFVDWLTNYGPPLAGALVAAAAYWSPNKARGVFGVGSSPLRLVPWVVVYGVLVGTWLLFFL